MVSSPNKSGPQALTAEISLQPGLKNCLANLPSSLVSVLVNANAAAQDVVVELTYRPNAAHSSSGKNDRKSASRSVYTGWTGMQSRRKLSSVLGDDGTVSRNGNVSSRDKDVPLVEIDSTFGKLLGLADGQKVGILLHRDPLEVHTVNIEPLTSADWELIELHANFLELNLLSQIRALPNPSHKQPGSPTNHPLTLHLSPTSTASITVTSVLPTPPSSLGFVKIARDAEVHVAPKSRVKTPPNAVGETKSVHSADGRSSTNTTRVKSVSSKAVFLRGVDRSLAAEWFDTTEDLEKDDGIRVWVDWTVLTSKEFRGISWAWVSVVRPSALQATPDSQQQATQSAIEGQELVKPALRVVAQICPWEDAPDSRHVALSSLLCGSLDIQGTVGEIVRLQPAPPKTAKTLVKTLRLFPFAPTSDRGQNGLKFGAKSKAAREEAGRMIHRIYGKTSDHAGLLEGPLTDGMMLPELADPSIDIAWEGGILKFEPPPGPPLDPAKTTRGWLLGVEKKLEIEVMAEIPRPPLASRDWAVGEMLPAVSPDLVGIDTTIEKLTSHVERLTSTLLTGGLGSGKTSLTHLIAHRLREQTLFSTTYLPCRSLVTEESRVATIKETLNRAFALAAWTVRLGGNALVILDDLDKLCPVETELEVSANGRSRHISEILLSIIREHCSSNSRVVLLATAQSKDSLNNVIVGGHVVREIIHLNAPDKEARRRVLEMLAHQRDKPAVVPPVSHPVNGDSFSEESSTGSSIPDLDTSQNHYHQDSISRIDLAASDASKELLVDSAIDFLDLAGQTDGYMPGDLALLVSRARSEALIRNLTSPPSSTSSILLDTSDFNAALKAFIPASLRNVTLQHSTTTFSSIGGLRSTRKTLLETLQYPTLYAPIFARCPLRLRSGLLLYGFPGCGKTLLASAVAGECGLNFISVKGPEILNKYIGASEKSVRDLFERAQAAKPCVLFFDEFDSVAPKRGHDSTGVTDRVVNQLLTQMDGAEGLSGVYVLAATSRPDLIDPALLRPGRLDKSLLCDMPNEEDRLDILRALSKKLRMSAAVLADGYGQTLNEVARRTEGYSGADLQAVVYNAQLEAIHDVLGDRESSVKPRQRGRVDSSSKVTSAVTNGKGSAPDFSYFLFGTEESLATPTLSAAAAATERHNIAAQLTAHRTAQQRARATRRASFSLGTNHAGAQAKMDEARSSEPTISWTHIEKALAQTRASISREERMRLTRIYREFVTGRNGEMPDGQGGNEIGGRSSLM